VVSEQTSSITETNQTEAGGHVMHEDDEGGECYRCTRHGNEWFLEPRHGNEQLSEYGKLNYKSEGMNV